MTTRVLIVNLGNTPINVDRVVGGNIESWRVATLSPSKEFAETYVYEGSDIRISEDKKEPETK